MVALGSNRRLGGSLSLMDGCRAPRRFPLRTDPRQAIASSAGRSQPGLADLPALARLVSLSFPGAHGRPGLEGSEHALGRVGHLLDGALESRLVGARGLLQAAHLAHVLNGGGPDLLFRRWRLEVVEDADVPAHGSQRVTRSRGCARAGGLRMVGRRPTSCPVWAFSSLHACACDRSGARPGVYGQSMPYSTLT